MAADITTGPETDGIADEYTGSELPISPETLGLTAEERVGENEDEEDEDHIDRWLANYRRGAFNPATLVPPLLWLPRYIRFILKCPTEDDKAACGSLPFSLTGDLIAGLTVGFMLVPQSLAFAMLAGLPVQTGLYASFLPLVLYSVFGTIRQVQPGPTALMSLLTGQALDGFGLVTDMQRVSGAAFMALVVGFISVLLGILRFGFIIDFMSHSVMTAFCTASGITIATSQLKHMVGIHVPRFKHWWETVFHLVGHIVEIDWPTAALGCTLLAMLLFLKKWKAAGSCEARRSHLLWRYLPTRKDGRAFQALKLVADLSSLLSVLIGWLWGLVYRQAGVDSVRMIGQVDNSGFHFAAPGEGISGYVDFDNVAISCMLMALVGFLETMAVGGKFAAQYRYSYDPNQELLALGLANIGSAVMAGYPTTGSFSRTAVNASFGATSLVACAISSLLVLASVLVLLPVVALLPLAALAPIIIQGAIGVVDVHHFRVALKANKAEFLVMLMTLVVSLGLTVKEGLLVGFVCSLLKTMFDLGNPNMCVCGKLEDGSFRDIRNFPKAELPKDAVIVRMDARLNFANCRKFKEFCLKALNVREDQDGRGAAKFVVVDAKSINHVDLSGCEMLVALAETLKTRGQGLILANLKGPVSRCLTKAGVPRAVKLNGGHLCISMDHALEIVQGKDPAEHEAHFNSLLKQVKSARRVMNSTGPLACTTSPNKLCNATSPRSYNTSPKSNISTPRSRPQAQQSFRPSDRFCMGGPPGGERSP